MRIFFVLCKSTYGDFYSPFSRSLLERHNIVICSAAAVCEAGAEMCKQFDAVLEYDHDTAPLPPHIIAFIDHTVTAHVLFCVPSVYSQQHSVEDWIREVRCVLFVRTFSRSRADRLDMCRKNYCTARLGSVVYLPDVLKMGAWPADIALPLPEGNLN